MPPKQDLKEEIYHSKSIIRSYSKALFSNPNITKKNKDTFKEFLQHLEALGISTRRISIYLRMYNTVASKTKVEFHKIDEKEMKRVWAQIEGSGYAAWTIETYKKTLKVFFRWLYGLDSSDSLPPVIKWAKGSNPPSTIKKKDLLTQEEFEKLVNCTENRMLRTMLGCFWETAVRPGELLNVRLNDLAIDEDHITLTVRGKMEKKQGPRDVFVIKTKDMLLQYLEHHPHKKDRSCPLWIVTEGYKNVGKPATLRYLYSKIRQLAVRAGIEKRVTPYIIRHSRGTAFHLMYGSAIASKMLGHAPDSRMGKVYLHLDQQDVLAALRNGSKGASSSDLLKEHESRSTCPKCGHVNFFDRIICVKCGHQIKDDFRPKLSLDKETIRKLTMIVNMIEDDSEIMHRMESPEWQKKHAEKLAKRDKI